MNIDIFEKDKGTIEKLLEIDNKINNSNITYDDLHNYFLNNNKNITIPVDDDNLIITDGDPFLTIDIIKNLSFSENNNILFISNSFIGINKWLGIFLAGAFNEILAIDEEENYNKYINKKIRCIPVGNKYLINQVKEDFKL